MNRNQCKVYIKEKLLISLSQAKNTPITPQQITGEINLLLEKNKNDTGAFTENERNSIIAEIISEMIGFGPVAPLLEDKDITEIMINGPGKIYVEKKGVKVLTGIKFENEQQLRALIARIIQPSGRRVDENLLFTDFYLADGSRVNVILPPLAHSGSTVTIRKFLPTIKDLDHLVKLGTMDSRMAVFLDACIKAKLNIIFSGATGSGKTTTLEVLSANISSDDRIIIIEDTIELHLRQDHVVRLLTRQSNIEGKGEVTIRDLFINCLRMRPTRIILGEIRGPEALDYLQALNSGHRGVLAVIHASSPDNVVTRLETAALLSGVNIASWALRQQIATGIDVILQHEQLSDGSRKITKISEVNSIDAGGNIKMNDIFYYEQTDFFIETGVIGEFKATGIIPYFWNVFKQKGLDISEDIFKN